MSIVVVTIFLLFLSIGIAPVAYYLWAKLHTNKKRYEKVIKLVFPNELINDSFYRELQNTERGTIPAILSKSRGAVRGSTINIEENVDVSRAFDNALNTEFLP